MHMTDTIPRDSSPASVFMPWVVCVSASLFFFYEFIQGNMFASIGEELMRDFHIKADTMALMSSIYYVSNVLFLFLAGMLLDRFSPKRTILFAMVLCIIGTFIFANTHSFAIAMTCRFITGIGSAFCFIGPIRIASRWFPSKRMALVTGIIVTIAMTGGMVAQTPLTHLVAEYGWRQSLMNIGYLGLIILLIMKIGIVERPEDKTQQDDSAPPSTLSTYLNMNNIAPAIYTSLMNMAIAVWGAMMGTAYLKQRLAVGADIASTINSMLFFGVIVGGPFMGWLSDRLSLRLPPMKLGVLLSVITVLFIMYAPLTPLTMGILFFLLGFFTSTQVISYALVAESNPPAVTARAVSVISILTQGGFVLYQMLYSLILVHKGQEVISADGTPIYALSGYQSANVIILIGAVIAGLVMYRVKETYCRPQEN
ncbi:MAG: MFS transporter [Legionellaceae bacterium]|nr:MFS transporter [Legionellaceae bacterium]